MSITDDGLRNGTVDCGGGIAVDEDEDTWRDTVGGEAVRACTCEGVRDRPGAGVTGPARALEGGLGGLGRADDAEAVLDAAGVDGGRARFPRFCHQSNESLLFIATSRHARSQLLSVLLGS